MKQVALGGILATLLFSFGGAARAESPHKSAGPALEAPKHAAPASVGVPEGEAELFDKHAVDHAKIAFRPGHGLHTESADGKFALTLRSRGQLLYTLVHDVKEKTEEVEQGLQIRRARLVFQGHTFSKHVKFKTELAIAPRDISLTTAGVTRSPLLDWYFDFTHLRDLSFRMGQYKVPFNRQRVVSSGNLQMVDRAIAQSEFNLDRDIGLDIRSKDLFGLGVLKYHAGVYVGEGHSSFANGDLGQMYLARLEVLPLGHFHDYSEVDFERRKRPGVSIGLAYAYVQQAKKNRAILGSTPSDKGTTDYSVGTADILLKVRGFSLATEVYLREGTRNPGSLLDDKGAPLVDDKGKPLEVEVARNGGGWFTQAGYLFPDTRFEIAGRVGAFGPLGTTSMKPSAEVGGGLNYYFARHPLKLQADYFRLFEPRDFAHGRDQIRLQLQVAL